MDDTDTQESRGTGRLARDIASELVNKYEIFGVTRHQLLVHPDIPFTSHNSCAVIHVQAPTPCIKDIFVSTKKMILEDFIVGSDPGLAIASEEQVRPAAIALGQDAKTMIVSQQRALNVSKNCGILVEGLGGTNGGIIGAIAGVALAALGNDGRFLIGLRDVAEIMGAGIDQIITQQGEVVNNGKVRIPKNVTPSFIQGKAVLFVEKGDNCMVALKRA
jgi:tRNA(Ile2) C34 agmatinyltransferase TiaS